MDSMTTLNRGATWYSGQLHLIVITDDIADSLIPGTYINLHTSSIPVWIPIGRLDELLFSAKPLPAGGEQSLALEDPLKTVVQFGPLT